MEASDKTHRPHIKVGKDAEEEEQLEYAARHNSIRRKSTEGRISRENNSTNWSAAPNYPRNGNNGVGRITVNKQMAATICASSQRRFAELLFLITFIKWTVKLVLKWVLSLSRQYVDDVRVSWFYNGNGFAAIWWTDKLIIIYTVEPHY